MHMHELAIPLNSSDVFMCLQTKKWNRKCEFLMRDVEIVSSLALVLSPKEQRFYLPSLELTRLWKIVLLNQFHDVLPGSSINAVRWIFIFTLCFLAPLVLSRCWLGGRKGIRPVN